DVERLEPQRAPIVQVAPLAFEDLIPQDQDRAAPVPQRDPAQRRRRQLFRPPAQLEVARPRVVAPQPGQVPPPEPPRPEGLRLVFVSPQGPQLGEDQVGADALGQQPPQGQQLQQGGATAYAEVEHHRGAAAGGPQPCEPAGADAAARARAAQQEDQG